MIGIVTPPATPREGRDHEDDPEDRARSTCLTTVELGPLLAPVVADGGHVHRDVHPCEQQSECVAEDEIGVERAGRLRVRAEPSQRLMPTAMMIPRIAWRWTALTGVRWSGGSAANAAGMSRERPSEKIDRVDAFAPELAFARQLLRMAKRTSRLPMPGSTSSAIPPHGLPSLESEEVGHVVGAEVDGRRVVAEDVEEADQDGRPEDRLTESSSSGRASPPRAVRPPRIRRMPAGRRPCPEAPAGCQRHPG